MSPGFDAGALERHYAFLDDCPDHLLPEVVTMTIGTLAERVAGVRGWRDALLAGRLPDEEVWPPAEWAAPVRRAISELGLVRFCKGEEALVDAVLTDIVRAFQRRDVLRRAEIIERLRALAALERRWLAGDADTPSSVRLDLATRRRLREQAEREVASRPPGADGPLVEAWDERVRAWATLAEVFGDLGEMMGRGWDMARGVLRHVGWVEVLRLRELLERLPQIRDIVRSLGRLHARDDDDDCISERLFTPVRRLDEERRESRTPLVPAETRGVVRSGDVARMLPIEAANLGHPRLRMLWHARRAERALLTYRVDGIEVEHVLVEREVQEELEVEHPRRERGPIIAVLDTSGSMHGLPEQVAKALVLDALRTAHAEKRRCLLFAYSGPQQVLEHELDLTPDGLVRLLAFLGHSFGGGNDEVGVLTRVAQRLEQEGWQRADVMFVSDGEWPAPREVLPLVARARERGGRFHGVQIGNEGLTGLHAICDPVHVFVDWAAAGGW